MAQQLCCRSDTARLAARGGLVIALPKTDHPAVVVEKADDGQCYYTIDAETEVPSKDQPARLIKYVVVFWDASGSACRRPPPRD